MTYGVFAFGLVDRSLAFGRLRHWLLLGGVVAWGSFHQPDLWLLFTVFTGVYFVFRAVIVRPSLKPFACGAALAAAVFFLVGAPSFHEALTGALSGRDRQIEDSKGSALSGGKDVSDNEARWIFVTNWSLPTSESAEFVCSRLNGDTSCPLTLSVNHAKGIRPYTGALGRPLNAKEGNYRQHSLYVGWITMLFAVIGVVSSKGRKTDVIFFAVAAVVFWLFSLGRYCEPVYRIVYMLPFGDYLRAPVKWHHLTEFCLCVLAGFGIAALGVWIRRYAKGNGKLLRVLNCALAAFVLWGAADLAVEARRFCAPVDYSRAVRIGCKSDLTVLSRQQFQNPQVAEMSRRGMIVSVANWLGSPDAYLVQVLQPLNHPKPAEPRALPLALGIVSVLSSIAVVAVCLWRWQLR